MATEVGLGIRNPWAPLTLDTARSLPGCLGVYEIAGPAGDVRKIGYAGGRSTFGLRGVLGEAAQAAEDSGGGPLMFRVEVNMQYMSRWVELLMIYRTSHGNLPPDNDPGDADGLGRLGAAFRGGLR